MHTAEAKATLSGAAVKASECAISPEKTLSAPFTRHSNTPAKIGHENGKVRHTREGEMQPPSKSRHSGECRYYIRPSLSTAESMERELFSH